MNQRIQQHVIVQPAQAGYRLDQAAAELFADFSRAQLQQWIRDGLLKRGGAVARPRDKVNAGDILQLDAELATHDHWLAQDMALDIVYEDATLLVIDKPAGLVVHPGAGSPDGTLLNALLHHDAQLAAIPRAGIVHRLDKDTTGLLVVARTLQAHAELIRQLQARTVKREYEAVVCGVLTGGGKVDAPIGRHPRDRIRMAVVSSGKPAVTHFRVIERFETYTHVRVQLETGRTHQIRVHMAHIGHPLLGDSIYGARVRLPKHADEVLTLALREFPRQALHAAQLGLLHPASGEYMQWQAPLPQDMQDLLLALNNHG
ncbi:MAG TPA: 23S rRNA pseudouridine(1911/1915/1917) synthase RluD [Pseudomonadales bacterium]|nr:23S rRNA pseudouridine(1911/1915/1917) synthase RluD [Pseudomonadales bacterium]